MGKASRDKGARVERALVEELKTKYGWTQVFRVPLSGASQGFKGDVVATPTGLTAHRNFEVKSRAKAFKRVYDLLRKHRVADRGEISFQASDGTCVVASFHPDPMFISASNFRFPPSSGFQDKTDRLAMQYLAKCREWLGKSDVLVLKGDREPFVYIRYFG